MKNNCVLKQKKSVNSDNLLEKMRCLLNKMRATTIRFFVVTILVLGVYLFIFDLLMAIWYRQKNVPILQNLVALPYVVVHLDLKGSPPKLSYLESLLPLLRDNGVNGLLIEYEDMFPYKENLVNLSAKNCYDRNDLRTFLNSAITKGFEVIPLIQTFGHMEHALKLKEFRHLREVDMYPDSICPSNPEGKMLVKGMLEQVINFHNSIRPLKHIHIGCDEVYHINKCKRCHNRTISNVNLFISYVGEVTSIVKELSPDTTTLIWDDMLQKITPRNWESINYSHHIEPVCWNYSPSLSVSHTNLLNYHKKFKNIWIASAFKGADGRTSTIPNLRNRFLNNFGWMNFILDYKFGGEKQVYSFKGIILTGWSRYSHMDPLCELLPASIPSLMLNLLLIKAFKTGIIAGDDANSDPDDFYTKYLEADMNKILKCNHDTVDIESFHNIENYFCKFESADIYNNLKRYNFLNADIKESFDDLENDLSLVEYYYRTNNINMNMVLRNLAWCKDMLRELMLTKTKLSYTMLPYYDNESIQEYINYKIYNTKRKLYNMVKILDKYMKIRTWERKPVQNISDTYYQNIDLKI